MANNDHIADECFQALIGGEINYQKDNDEVPDSDDIIWRGKICGVTVEHSGNRRTVTFAITDATAFNYHASLWETAEIGFAMIEPAFFKIVRVDGGGLEMEGLTEAECYVLSPGK